MLTHPSYDGATRSLSWSEAGGDPARVDGQWLRIEFLSIGGQSVAASMMLRPGAPGWSFPANWPTLFDGLLPDPGQPVTAYVDLIDDLEPAGGYAPLRQGWAYSLSGPPPTSDYPRQRRVSFKARF